MMGHSTPSWPGTRPRLTYPLAPRGAVSPAVLDVGKTGPNAYLRAMPRKSIDLPPEVARAFVTGMRVFFAVGHDTIKQDEIAARRLWLLKQHWNGNLRITDVRAMFRQMQKAGI